MDNDDEEGRTEGFPSFNKWSAASVQKVTAAIKAKESLQLVASILFILLWTHFYRPHVLLYVYLEYPINWFNGQDRRCFFCSSSSFRESFYDRTSGQSFIALSNMGI